MKYFNNVLASFVLSGFLLTSMLYGDPMNRLNWVEVLEKDFSTQVMFDFAKSIDFRPEVVEHSKLVLSFLGMQRSEFDVDKVRGGMEKLKNSGILSDFVVIESDNNAPAIKLVLTLAPSRVVKNAQNMPVSIKNRLAIKYSLVENEKPNEPSYRLVLDIFTKEILDTLEQRTGILLHAQNGHAGKKKILA